MSKAYTCLLILLLLSGFLMGQQAQVQVSYKLIPDNSTSNQVDTVHVYLKSTNHNIVKLRALNFSITYQDSCLRYHGYSFPYRSTWGSTFERSRIDSNLNLLYDHIKYNRRLSFGSADGNLFTPAPISVPPDSSAPLQVLSITFSKQSSTHPSYVYLEDETQNTRNQLGDTLMFPVRFEVERPLLLPLDHIFLHADILDEKTVRIWWQAAGSVEEGGTFYVEKSISKDFATARVLGTRTTDDWHGIPDNYIYDDEGPRSGTAIYRIRHVGLQGRITYSEAVEVHFDLLQTAPQVKLYPNPAHDVINCYINQLADVSYIVSIYDVYGRILISRHIELGASHGLLGSMDITKLQPGHYLLNIRRPRDGRFYKTLPFVKY